MMPNFSDNQITFIDKISTRLMPLKRWEVVIYKDMTANGGEIKVKRIIGLPYENIEISDGKIMLISESSRNEIYENYLPENTLTCLPWSCTDLSPHTFHVPENSYFVLGDNRSNSRDSRGCQDVASCDNPPVYVPAEEILGRVIVTF